MYFRDTHSMNWFVMTFCTVVDKYAYLGLCFCMMIYHATLATSTETLSRGAAPPP